MSPPDYPSAMPAPILLGQSHFPSLRAEGRYYVDKSMYAAEVVDAPAQVMLFPRPRRFGKTLNLSMLQTFFEVGPDRSGMFADLAVWAHMLSLHVSGHDVKRDQDEAFYHAFVLGLLVTLERTHAVRSNRAVGSGRADVQVIPRRPGLPGAVLEFKRRQGLTDLADTADAALRQIQARGYDTELVAAGASAIHRFGIAFGGKDVAVRQGYPPPE